VIAPAAPEPTPSPWYVRPAVVLPIIGVLVLFSALLAPDGIVGRTGNPRLSTWSTEPQGARLFYELTQRLGWQAERREVRGFGADPAVIHAVLDPDLPLQQTDVRQLLEHVRNGGALFVVLGAGAAGIADSLHVTWEGLAYFTTAASGDAGDAGCPPRRQAFTPLWPDDRPHLNVLRWSRPAPPDVEHFLPLELPRAPVRAGPVVVTTDTLPRRRMRDQFAAAGFPYGRGRIVIASDPDILRNDVLRACDYGIALPAVRMLEYLSAGAGVARRRVVFDEFHHGFGAQPGTMRAIARYLGGTGSGHLLFQLLGAGLLLLLAAAPRDIPPTDPERIERRSPLEHVDALARAYAQVAATRTATTRLLHGVRRRLERGSVQRGAVHTDDVFLENAEALAPALQPEVALIRRALRTTVPRREFAAVGAALERLESSLRRT
jgi:hypothetical protein